MAFNASPMATRSRSNSTMVSAFVLSRLDYCNSTLAGLHQSRIAPLQEVQNAPARLIMSLRSRDDITPALRLHHWLPVKCFRATYKLCLLMHAVHIGLCLGYIIDLVTSTSSLPGRDRLRSAVGNRYELPVFHHKIGERAFSHVGPAPGTIFHNISWDNRI